jgi:hypothetical protein
MAIDVRDGWLYALHSIRSVSKLQLHDGLPVPGAVWSKCFDIGPDDVPTPGAMAVGSSGKAIYVSDVQSNLVAKLDGLTGKRLLYFGDTQAVPVPEPKSGTYAKQRLMGPTSLAVWAGAGGSAGPPSSVNDGGVGTGSAAVDGAAADHVLVLETRGPARIGEWDGTYGARFSTEICTRGCH